MLFFSNVPKSTSKTQGIMSSCMKYLIKLDIYFSIICNWQLLKWVIDQISLIDRKGGSLFSADCKTKKANLIKD